VGSDELFLKQEFFAMMLGVQPPTVTVVMRALQDTGLIATKYRAHSRAQEKKAEGDVLRMSRRDRSTFPAPRPVTLHRLTAERSPNALETTRPLDESH
jgi:hypothetical protein